MFYCLVVGSRDFNDYQTMCDVLDYLLQNHKEVTIISGGARGADSLAETYALNHNCRLKVFKADWNHHGKRAGYLRNEEMHQYIAQFEKRGVVAFWDGSSKGTAHNFELCVKYNNPLRCFNYSIGSYINSLSGI